MAQGLKRMVAAVFLGGLGACGPMVESAEAKGPGCEAGHARCVGGCKSEHTRCQTQVGVLCAPQAYAVAACVAQACPPGEFQGCKQGCADAYTACTSKPR